MGSGFDAILNDIELIKKRISGIEKTKLSIGWFENARYNEDLPVAQVALWQEFGTKRIPERPFFRPAIDKNMPTWLNSITNVFKAIIYGKIPNQSGFDMLGGQISAHVKNEIAHDKHLALSPITLGLRRWKRENSTQEIPPYIVWKMFKAVKKGETGEGEFAEPDKNTDPLRDTGFMLATLTWEQGSNND